MVDDANTFWPGGAQLAVSFSLMFGAGGQPSSGAGSTVLEPAAPGAPGVSTAGFFRYGVYEGVPRLLDLFDRHGVKMSSFMVGRAVDRAPDLAREIVRRGHEAAAHGPIRESGDALDADGERRVIADVVESIVRATGTPPVGWNTDGVRNSARTLDLLQDLGFTYHVDAPSRDEPLLVPLRGGDFVAVPDTPHLNDVVSFPFLCWHPQAYEQALEDEFDQLYDEGARRRRMLVISLHDRISGHANRVRALDRFLEYARSRPDVWFARKDEIAAWVLAHRAGTPVEPSDPPPDG